jgi:hypothetical protein
MNTKRQTGISVAYAGGKITWSAEGEEALVIDTDALSESIRNAALMHGIDQKVTDAGAMGFGNWDGEDKPKRYATVAERLTRMRAVAARLRNGEWRAKHSRDPLEGLTAEQLKQLQDRVASKLAGLGI